MMDAEVISLAINIYKLLGLKDVSVKINTLGDQESRDNYRKVLLNYFKPHLEELCDDCKERFEKNPLRILDCKIDSEKDLVKNCPKTIDNLNKESKKRFDKVLEYLDMLQVKYVIDPSIVRGLDYYNHTIFEFVANVEGIGSIGGGGRYNKLVEELDGPVTPAVGFATGTDRLLLAIEKSKITLNTERDIDLFLLYVNEVEKNYAIYLTQELRMNGFKVETEYMSRSLKAQFKQADRLKSKFVSVLNSEDLDNNEIKIKNSKTKTEEIISLEAIIYYLDEQLSLIEHHDDIYDVEDYVVEEEN